LTKFVEEGTKKEKADRRKEGTKEGGKHKAAVLTSVVN